MKLNIKKLTRQELTEELLKAHQRINILAASLGHYIEFNKNGKEFDEYLKELKKENERKQAEKEKEAK